MVKALGIGGIFFRSKDPSALAQWYHTHFDINPVPTSPTMQPWISEAGVTVFSPFSQDTDYFPENQAFMLNFRVENLDAAIEELSAAGIDCGEKSSMEGIGHFARVHDPDGNPIELWEQVAP